MGGASAAIRRPPWLAGVLPLLVLAGEEHVWTFRLGIPLISLATAVLLLGAVDRPGRLRSTLEIFLRTGGSFKATAEQQLMHANSVKYRVRRALQRRGREIADDRLDVEVALAVRRIFGPHAPGNPAR